MTAYVLTVLTPIIPGHEVPLRDHLEHLGLGTKSPLASLRATHFARWVVFEPPIRQEVPQKSDVPRLQYLLFDSCVDGDRDEYLETMRTVISADVDAVWKHCVGYPGSTDPAAFAAYFHRHQADASLFIAAYPQATVQDVRASLELRQRLIDFAVTTQQFDAPALLAAYREVLMAAEGP